MTTKQALHPHTVLAVAAHPDDIDFSMAGTVATWANEGAAIYYLILTDGGKGSADRHITCDEVTKTRRQEQDEAARILGVRKVYYCNYADGTLVNDQAVKKDIVRIIRKTKPDIVMTMDPTVLYSLSLGVINHTDHRAAGEAAIDAVYPLARDHLSFPELLEKEKLEPHIVRTVLLTNFDSHNFAVDITGSMEKKLEALAAHESQFSDVKTVQDRVRNLAESVGRLSGSKYGESFIRLDLPF